MFAECLIPKIRVPLLPVTVLKTQGLCAAVGTRIYASKYWDQAVGATGSSVGAHLEVIYTSLAFILDFSGTRAASTRSPRLRVIQKCSKSPGATSPNEFLSEGKADAPNWCKAMQIRGNHENRGEYRASSHAGCPGFESLRAHHCFQRLAHCSKPSRGRIPTQNVCFFS
jgi:hypothetical protein